MNKALRENATPQAKATIQLDQPSPKEHNKLFQRRVSSYKQSLPLAISLKVFIANC